MLESIQAMSLLTIMEIVGPMLLAAALIYGTVQWSRRRAGTTDRIRAAATRRLYREAEREEAMEQEPELAGTAAASEESQGVDPATLGRLRSGREGERLSEDDIVQAHFGPRGVPGEAPTPKHLDEAETQISKQLDPGHTA
jgi:hypothetical protein